METMTVTNEKTLQQGLNDVVINKVQRMIDGKSVGVQATMERLISEARFLNKSRQDFNAVQTAVAVRENTPNLLPYGSDKNTASFRPTAMLVQNFVLSARER